MDKWNNIPIVDEGHQLGNFDPGLVERDYEKFPVGYLCPAMEAVDIPLVSDSEVLDRVREMKEKESSLYDIVLHGMPDGSQIPTVYQNGYGYCWAHSTTHAVTAIRARDNQKYVPLSAFAIAATIKKGKNEGGWGAQSLEFAQQVGIPSQDLWPQQNTDYRRLDTPEMRANAALHKVVEGWVDLTPPVYSRTFTKRQVDTCLLNRTPVVADYNFMSHSVCLLTLIEVEAGSLGVIAWNSQYKDLSKAFMILRGNRTYPDGAVAPRVVTPSSK